MNWRDDSRFNPPFHSRAANKRPDARNVMQKAIDSAFVEARGRDVTLRFSNGTFISYTPMPDHYWDMVERKLKRNRA